MTITTKRCIAFAVALAVCMFASWLSGIDFDKRGSETGIAFISSVLLSIFAATYPFTEETK